MAKVVIENLVKVYAEKKGPGVRAVNDIDLTIEEGEFMVLVGPSGCGKSTTLRMIAGLEEISSGTISIDGRVINTVLPKDRDIAMVFQNYALYPHMTVFENMAFGLRLRKFSRSEIDARVKDAAGILGIEALLDRRPKALSGGQRQRVAVGRAIVRKPKVFLFDEPLSNLDAKMRVTMRTEITRLHDRLATTMIYVTHDQVEAMTMGDRICVMKDGNIMQVATPLELYHHPANLFVAGFIGSPSMNFLRGRIEAAGDSLDFVEEQPGGRPLRIRLDAILARKAAAHVGRPIILGIRPEDVIEQGRDEPVEAGCTATVAVEASETMGYETCHYLNTGAHAFVARVRSSTDSITPSTLNVRFNLAHAHLFDPVTEQAVV